MSQCFNFWHKTNFHISFAAAFLYLYYCLVLNSNFFITTPFFIFCATLIAYTLLRFIPYLKKEKIDQKYYEWYQTHKILTFILLALAIIGLGITIEDLSFFQISLLLFLSLITILYEHLIFIPKGLRSVKYIKPFLIAFVWSGLCVGMAAENFGMSHLKYYIDAFVFIALLCMPFDLKDRGFDLSGGTLTLMGRFGHHPKIHIILSGLFAGYLFFYAYYISPYGFEINLIFQFIIYSSVFYALVKNKMQSNIIHDLLIDGIIYIKTVPLVCSLF